MENNQAHKIDKIFKNSLDNQSVTPPTDAWMAVHTYTIGQEESKKKVWLRYVSLALVLLLFSGLGFWYNINLNSDSSDLRISGLKTQIKIQKSTNLMNPNSDEIPSSILLSQELLVENTNNGEKEFAYLSNNQVTRKFPQNLLSHELLVENTNNGENSNSDEVASDSISSHTSKLLSQELSVVNAKNSENEIQPVELMAKDYVSTDLSKKMNETLMNVIPDNYLEEDSDVEETGKKFSLKHPIITCGGGVNLDFWSITRNNNLYSDVINLPNSNHSENLIKIGVAWKLNNQLRIGLSFINNQINLISKDGYGLNFNYKFGKSGSYEELIKVKLENSVLDKFYTSISPFGGNISVKSFPNQIQPITNDTMVFVNFQVPNSMKTISFVINTQYDLLNRIRKNKNGFKYQIYGLADFMVQRQTKYAYKESAIILYSPDGVGGYSKDVLTTENNHLQNASEFVFGLRAGLGFRYQFARKWDFYVEGSGQHSLNNWVKSNDIKTFQRALSLQVGINLNL